MLPGFRFQKYENFLVPEHFPNDFMQKIIQLDINYETL